MHAPSVDAVPGHRLERIAHRAIVGFDGVAVFTESVGRRVDEHEMPVWKLVLGHAEPVEVTTADTRVTGWAVLVPPGSRHSASSRGPFSAALFDPGTVRGEEPGRVVAIGPTRARELVGLLRDPVPDVPLRDALVDSLGSTLEPDDRRIASSVRRMRPGTSAGAVAEELGISAQHLRRLLRDEVGVTFTQLRRWVALRDAVLGLTTRSIVDTAVGAGFADQPHLTRVSRAMLGRTPGSLVPRRGSTNVGVNR